MKKTFLITALLGTTLSFATLAGTTAHAAEQEDVGSTDVVADVTSGDFRFTVDSMVKYDAQPFASTIDFGTHAINYTVSDNTGDTNGYTLSAHLMDNGSEDASFTRTLKFVDDAGADVLVLSATEGLVEAPTTNVVGDNTKSATISLVYSNVTSLEEFEMNPISTIMWEVTKDGSQLNP